MNRDYRDYLAANISLSDYTNYQQSNLHLDVTQEKKHQKLLVHVVQGSQDGEELHEVTAACCIGGLGLSLSL